MEYKEIVIPPPGQRSGFIRVGVTMPKDLSKQIKLTAIKQDVDFSTFIRDACLKHIKDLEG